MTKAPPRPMSAPALPLVAKLGRAPESFHGGEPAASSQPSVCSPASGPAYLCEVLCMMLRGHKHHRLVLGPHHVA
jgi:hypothetical protein